VEGEDDAALVGAAREGDTSALDALLRRHHDRIHAVCRRMTANEADADDATQEALVAIVRGLPRFDGRSRFSTWAYRVATNACLDELRRHRRRPQPAGGVGLEEGGLGDGGARASPSAAEGGRGAAADGVAADRVDVSRALSKLAPEFRAAVVLRDLCGLDYAEIAEVLGVPPGTVRSRIARGRAALVPLLAPGHRPGPDAGPGRPGGPGQGNPSPLDDRPSSRP